MAILYVYVTIRHQQPPSDIALAEVTTLLQTIHATYRCGTAQARWRVLPRVLPRRMQALDARYKCRAHLFAFVKRAPLFHR